jgi:hypothetical protein
MKLSYRWVILGVLIGVTIALAGCRTASRDEIRTAEGDIIISTSNAETPANLTRKTLDIPAGSHVTIEIDGTTKVIPSRDTQSKYIHVQTSIPKDNLKAELHEWTRRGLLFLSIIFGTASVFSLLVLPKSLFRGLELTGAFGISAAMCWLLAQWEGFVGQNWWAYLLIFSGVGFIILMEIGRKGWITLPNFLKSKKDKPVINPS